jgi:sirohydrochlorin cobaltochelatase
MDGLVLFAHGARDPRWREPFERLATKVREARPGLPVRLAFLELMTPDLRSAIEALAGAGCASIRVVPVFLGQGGHVRSDLPALFQDAVARHPQCRFQLAVAAGEDDAVLEALAEYCVRQSTATAVR